MAYAIGLGGCVTLLALHVILAYLRRMERRIAMPRPHIIAQSRRAEASVLDPLDVVDPRVAKIISEIPQRRTRGHTYGRELAPAR